MSGVSCRRYRGPLKAAVLDWAGTVVDFGCQAPAATFVEAFAAEGIAISIAQARAPMGMAKRDHIKAITAMPDVASTWQARNGRAIGEAEIRAALAAIGETMREMGVASGAPAPRGETESRE